MAVAHADWKDLLRIRVWTPLAAVSIETTKLSENVRKIEDGKYLVVVESDLAGNANGGPYVTMVAWAGTDGAVLRAIDGALEADVEQRANVKPPDELIPAAEASEYVSISASLKKRGESVLESGEYRIASDGIFLHKVVRSTNATYYFRSPEMIDGEIPFAITHRIAAPA